MRRVYLDNNATTPVLPEVFEAMRPFYLEQFGNASSIHHYGQHARAAVEKARASVAALVNARPAEIVFTSGGTEADNLGIFGLVQRGDHVITSTIEHSAVMNTCKRLEQMGCEVTYVPVNAQGEIIRQSVEMALRPNTRLISIMMANNETGVIQPVEEIGKIAQEADVFFIPTQSRPQAKCRSTYRKLRAMRFRFPATRSMRRKAPARFTSRRER